MWAIKSISQKWNEFLAEARESYAIGTARGNAVVGRKMFPDESCYFTLPLRPRSNQIRVLYIRDAATADAQLVCDLHIIELEQGFEYTALSYCWGDFAFNKTIILNGKPFSITQNLECALKGLRSRFSWVWVDQLCIDQQDIEERSSQVILMSRIYSQAEHVAMYLGHEGPDTVLFFQWLNELRAAVVGCRAPATFNDATFRGEVKPTTLPWATTGKVSNGSSDVFERDYFYRGWIIQEVALAKTASCFFGDHWFDISLFDPLTSWFYDEQRQLPGWDPRLPLAIPTRSERATSPGLFELIARNLNVKLDGDRMLWLLENTANFELRDPRDRFYSLLGLVPDPDTYPVPDYSSNQEDVYYEYAVRLLRTPNELRILWNADLSCSKPSWVPAWTEPRMELSIYSNYLNTEAGEPRVMLHHNERMLTVAASHVDIVVTSTYGEYVPSADEASCQSWGANVRAWILSSLAIIKNLPTFSEQGDGAAREALSKLIWQGTPNSPSMFTYPFTSGDASDAIQKLLNTITADITSRQQHSTLLGNMAAEKRNMDVDADAIKLLSSLLIEGCYLKRKVIVTASGRYGLGPEGARDGDCVVRFNGAPFISILRKTLDGFFLVGHIRFSGDQDRDLIGAPGQIFEDFDII